MATPIQASTRYYRRGVTKVLWVPTIANLQAPTRAELDAGTELADEVSAMSGWQTTSGTVPTPALGSRFTPTVPGEITAADSSLTFWASKTADDVRILLVREAVGNVVWMDEGDVPDQTMDIFPVSVMSQAKVRELDGASQIMAQFAITREPAENVTIPAAAGG
ncbi:phage tail tube protein [Streptomyces hirsutus]|uniref:phage tail tube protein n=1 Tax=Streptomyces hirsutus TaxID=35620 RepID=UPI0036ABD8F9